MLQEKVQFLSGALSFSAASGFFVSYFNRRCCWIVCGVSVGLNLILFAGLLYWKFFIPQPPPPGYGGYPSQGIFPLRRSSSVFMLLEIGQVTKRKDMRMFNNPNLQDMGRRHSPLQPLQPPKLQITATKHCKIRFCVSIHNPHPRFDIHLKPILCQTVSFTSSPLCLELNA